MGIYSDDKSQTVEIGGQEFGVNVDYGLKYCDAAGNIYTFAVVDIDADGSGNHYNNVGENGKILNQLDGPEITGSTQLSLLTIAITLYNIQSFSRHIIYRLQYPPTYLQKSSNYFLFRWKLFIIIDPL